MPRGDDEIGDDDGGSVSPDGVVSAPTVDVPAGYTYGVTRYADVVLSNALPERFDELCSSLDDFKIELDELRTGGGGRTPFVKRFDDSLGRRTSAAGAALWGKRNVTIEHRIGFDGQTDPVARTRGHEIDMFGEASAVVPFPGVAVEMEWNNKDPFFDRDLINFQALHREGAIVAGVIVTRGPQLQRCLSNVLDKYGSSSTHWDKLIPRVNLGGGGECPLLLIGIEPARVTGVAVIDERMALVEEADAIQRRWRDLGYASRSAAMVRVRELKRRAIIGRLEREE